MSPNLESIGKVIIIIGLTLLILGGIVLGLSRIFGWEKLPGTLRFESGNITCLVPILGSILLSIILTLILNILIRFFNR